jgi:hypothetical protein
MEYDKQDDPCDDISENVTAWIKQPISAAYKAAIT